MFKERLTRLRTEKKLTQQQMGNMLGITRQAYGNYESGKREPDTDTIQKLADYFGVSVDFLLARTDEPNLVDSSDKEKPLNVAWFGGRKEVLTDEEADKLQEALEIHRMLKEKRMKEKNKK